MDQWTAQERLMSPHGIAFRRWRGFHRLGVAIGGATMATGLAFVGAAVTRLELVELLSADTFAIVLGSAFVLLGVIAIGAYGVVRAIERFSR